MLSMFAVSPFTGGFSTSYCGKPVSNPHLLKTSSFLGCLPFSTSPFSGKILMLMSPFSGKGLFLRPRFRDAYKGS